MSGCASPKESFADIASRQAWTELLYCSSSFNGLLGPVGWEWLRSVVVPCGGVSGCLVVVYT